ncbi:MAG: hypothetical protein P8Z80_21195, partial [Pseudolabrys sp.]
MTFDPSSLFRNELANQAVDRPQETRLIGRPITDPEAQAEANFYLDHGMTREQYVDMLERRKRIDFEERATAEVMFNDPPENLCNTTGLSPKRARF